MTNDCLFAPPPGIPLHLVDQRQKEPLVVLDVVLLHIGRPELEPDSHAARRLPVVVAKVFGGLDIVLVAVGPVKVYFFAVVRYGVTMAPRIAALRYEVAFLIVAVENSYRRL